MVDKSSNFQDFVLFLRNEIGEYNIEISKTTIFEDDLGLTGDEAYEFIGKFGKEYNVDISNFDASLYFYPEPSLFNVIKSVKPLTVGDLFNSIEERKLI